MLSNLLAGAVWIVTLLSGLAVLVIGASGASGSSAQDGGRAMGTMMVSPFFALSLLAAFALAQWRGGLDWLTPQSPGLRWSVVLLVVPAAALLACLCAAVRPEPASQVPWAVLPLRGWLHWVWPPVLVAGSALVLWPRIADGLPALAWRGPLAFVGAVTLLAAGALLMQLLQHQAERDLARAESALRDEDRRDATIREQIDRADVVNNFADFTSLMSQTSKWEKPELRQAALARLHAHPGFTADMARLLRSGWRDHAFSYLADNDPPDARALLDAVRAAFAATPPDFQQRLADAHYLRADEYLPEVLRLLDVAARFEPLGLDPLPTVRALQAALAAPRPSDTKLEASVRIERWLAARNKR